MSWRNRFGGSRQQHFDRRPHKSPQERRHRQQLMATQPQVDFNATIYYQQTVIDNLSVNFGHSMGQFSSVKRTVSRIYDLLVLALCRHDPLPLMVRSAIESRVLASPPPLLQSLPPPPAPQPTSLPCPPLSPHQPLQSKVRSPHQPLQPKVHTPHPLLQPKVLSPHQPLQPKMRTPHPPLQPKVLSPHEPLFELQQRSDFETITALDIPYTLRHFDFELSVAANNSDATAGAPTTLSPAFATATAAIAQTGTATCDPAVGGSISFSLAETQTGCLSVDRGTSKAFHWVADLLVDARMLATVRRALKNTASEATLRRQRNKSGSSDHSDCSKAHSQASAPANSAFDTSPAASSAESLHSRDLRSAGSVTTSASPRPSFRTSTTGLARLTAPLVLTVGLDGSNSNRTSAQLLGNSHQRSTVNSANPAAGSGSGGAGRSRVCPLHADQSRAPAKESSCAVCASQHFLNRHMQRLVLEASPGGIASLEDALCNCLRLQEQWRHSVNWVATNVRDRRLPDALKPLIRCICTDAVCDSGRSQGVTVNPQIIISTDGHCSALQCVSRCGSGGGCGGSGGGGFGGRNAGGEGGGGGGKWIGVGASGNCCWDAEPTAGRDAS